MLESNLLSQLQIHFQKIIRPVHFHVNLDDSEKSKELRTILEQLLPLSPYFKWIDEEGYSRTPSFSITTPGQDIHLRFSGIPMGHEFTSLVLALLHVGGLFQK